MKLIFVMLTSAAVVGASPAETIDFDHAAVGQPPAGWTATRTGSGDAKWTIEKDDTAPSKPNVLKQSGVATYPVCFKNDASEVKSGFECGISLANYNDIKPGDVIEAFVTERVAAEAMA